MTAKLLPLSSLLGASLALGLVACSKEQKGTTPARAEAASGEIHQAESLKATVQAVDHTQRTVTFEDEAGRPFVVHVGENVELERMQPDDAVLVTYRESVEFALRDQADESGGQPAVEQSARRIPDGVQFGRKIDTTVEILAVSADGSHATFRGPEGGVRTVYVNDSSSQEKVAHLRAGDTVAVTYTEKLEVELEQANRD